jgi:hypothetical protein
MAVSSLPRSGQWHKISVAPSAAEYGIDETLLNHHPQDAGSLDLWHEISALSPNALLPQIRLLLPLPSGFQQASRMRLHFALRRLIELIEQGNPHG